MDKLPGELLGQIVTYLDRNAQKSFSLVNRRAWDAATCEIWRSVMLVDTQSTHLVPEQQKAHWSQDTWLGRDEHDDTPLIRKLLILAANKSLASKVKILTHRCHLPIPAIFSELPTLCFRNVSLSNDPRTLQLVKLAAKNMGNLQMLRIVHGHYNLSYRLLAEFFSSERKLTPRHVWIEGSSAVGFPGVAQPGYLHMLVPRPIALESLRLRRLQIKEGEGEYRYARAGTITSLHNGYGSTYETTVEQGPLTDITTSKAVEWLNEQTYAGIPEALAFFKSTKGKPTELSPVFHTLLPPWTFAIFLTSPTQSLRSLTLDWMLANRGSSRTDEDQWTNFEHLSQMVFPNLRAFQIRNAVTGDTKLSMGIWLLYPKDEFERSPAIEDNREFHVDMLTFMENHPNLECLAWPMDRFYPHSRGTGRSEDKLKARAAAVVANLGRTLKTLRVDSYYTSRGECQTDEGGDVEARTMRVRRRLFVSDFASHMTKLSQLKVEGGIPRDEKRELTRAVHRCPLEKLVMIGVSCPLGNTWGSNGEDLSAIDDGQLQFQGLLESEHEDTTASFAPAPPGYTFRPEYGWPPGPPLLHTIAMYHASTITELKFCGYNGSPVLHRPTAITSSLLHHLRHFHNLRRFILSFWLLTFFDYDWREPEIIDYWLDQRNPSSTALVHIPEAAEISSEVSEVDEDTDAVEGAVPINEGNTIIAAVDAADNTPAVDVEADNTQAVVTQSHNNHSLLDTLSALAAGMPAEDVTPNTMMAAALGVGVVDSTTQVDENTVVPQTPQQHNQPSHPMMHLTPPPVPIVGAPLPPPPVFDTNPWEQKLRRFFTPKALARGVSDVVSPHLSPQALERKDGVFVRASFCLGVESGDIFDLDLQLDEGGVVDGSVVGPREESETKRWWGKLENRQWFG